MANLAEILTNSLVPQNNAVDPMLARIMGFNQVTPMETAMADAIKDTQADRRVARSAQIQKLINDGAPEWLLMYAAGGEVDMDAIKKSD